MTSLVVVWAAHKVEHTQDAACHNSIKNDKRNLMVPEQNSSRLFLSACVRRQHIKKNILRVCFHIFWLSTKPTPAVVARRIYTQIYRNTIYADENILYIYVASAHTKSIIQYWRTQMLELEIIIATTTRELLRTARRRSFDNAQITFSIWISVEHVCVRLGSNYCQVLLRENHAWDGKPYTGLSRNCIVKGLSARGGGDITINLMLAQWNKTHSINCYLHTVTLRPDNETTQMMWHTKYLSQKSDFVVY